ncbi:MAG TPA: ParB/RepB/Spo0J family partition protein [Candidatus Ozemobacteraceae bacterium]|nr:ParB/RepB/Spo0J family partition protein [Candidatus Ozemobacteraceae bacterium]
MEFHLIPLDRVHINPRQPRKFFDSEKIEELAQSIHANGILQPILVRAKGDRYEIISGERRYRAARIAGLDRIPAVIRSLADREAHFAAIIENLQREDLNPVEEAQALREVILEYSLTHDQLAERLGKSRSAVTNLLRILQLPDDVQSLISNGKISPGHAKILVGLRDLKEIRRWVRQIVRENLSVYETERQLAHARTETKAKTEAGTKGKKAVTGDLHVRHAEDNLMEALGAKVRIRQGRKRGVIEIEFYSPDDLERLIENLGSCRL